MGFSEKDEVNDKAEDYIKRNCRTFRRTHGRFNGNLSNMDFKSWRKAA